MTGLLNRFAGRWRSGARALANAAGRFVTAGSLVVAAAAMLAMLTAGPLRAASDLDATFDADVRLFGYGATMATQADGKLLVGGSFSRARGAALANLARFNPDGTVDASFAVGANINHGVRALAVLADGKILVAGTFTAYGATSRNGILRLNADGTLDATFDPGTGFNAEVIDFAVQSDGKIIAVGFFTAFNGTARNRIARLNANGSLDTTFLASGAAANDVVWDVTLQSDGKPVIAGEFTTYNGTARNRLARLTTAGALDTTVAFTGGANNDIYSVALDASGRFVIGGIFTTWNGTARNYIARLTAAGALDATFDPGATSFNNVVTRVALDSAGRVIAGGRMTSFNGVALAMPGLARLTAAGAADAGFAPEADIFALGRRGYIETVAVGAGDGLMVLGSFHDTVTGAAGLVSLTSGGARDPAFDIGRGLEFAPRVNAVRPGREGKYYVMGEFDWIGGKPCADVARFLPNARLDPGFASAASFGGDAYFDAPVLDGVELPNGSFWVFGAFTKYGSFNRPGAALFSSNGYAEITSTTLTITGGSVRRAVLGVDGKVTLAGSFTSVNGTPRAGVARVLTTGALDTTFAPGSGPAGGAILDADIDADGRLLVGGSFTAFSGTAEAYLVRLGATGAVDTAFAGNTSVSAQVNSVQALPDGKALIGGIFANSGGFAVNGVDRLNADGTTDVNFNPGAGANSYVYSARADAAGRVLLAGAFTAVRGESRPGGLARLGASGASDNLFAQTSLAGGYAFEAVPRPDGKIVVNGSFTGVDGAPRVALARFHSTPVRRGALVTAFDGAVLAAGDVRAVLPAAGGGFVLAGDFTTAAGVTRNRIVKVGQTGQLDPAFAYTSGFDRLVHGGSLEPDGKFLFWGEFASYNGAGASGVVRVNADGTRDTGFTSPTFNSAVHAVVRLPDGDYLVAGAFTSADATTVGGLVRLNADGSFDSAFNAGAGANGAVLALARAGDGSIFAGGAFTNFAGTSAPGVVKLTATGARAAGFAIGTGNPNTYLPVRALALQTDGKLLVGGEFTTFNGQTVARLVRLNADGTRDAAFLGGLGADATVRALAPLADGRIFVGGAFTSLGGGEQRGLARLTAAGAIDPVFDVGSGFNHEVFAVTPLADGRVAVGGKFTTVSGEARNRFAVLYAGDEGAPILTTDAFQTIEVNPGQGFLLSVGSAPIAGFSYQWYRDGVLLPGATNFNYSVGAAALGDLGTYTAVLSNGGGEATTLGTRVIVKLSPAITGAPVAQAVGYGAGATFTVGVSGPGPFTYQWFRNGEAISGQTGSTLVLSNAGDTDFGDTFFVRVTNAYGSIDTTPVALNFDPAAVPGAVVRAFAGQAPVLTYPAEALVRTPGGQYYVAGGSKLLRLNADGSTDASFAPTLASVDVTAMAVQADGKLVVIGYIQPAGGTTVRVARFLTTGAIDPSFVVPTFEKAQLDSFGNTYYWGGDPLALALQADGKIVIGGDFTRVAGIDRLNIVRLNTDGSLDTGFAPSNASTGANGRVSAVIVVGTNLLLAGDFTTYRGTTANRLVRITAANAIDTTFVGGTRANGPVQGLLRQADGKIFVRGTFTAYNGTARNRLARLNADGTLDTAFNPGEGPQPNSIGDAVEIAGFGLGGNGALIVGGSFGSFSGWPATRSVRLTSTGAIDTQWSSSGDFWTLLPVSEEEVFVGGVYTFAGLTGSQYLGRLLGGAYPPQPPAFGLQPVGSSYAYAAGSSRVLSARAAGPGTLSFQWYRDGVAVTNTTLITGATGPVLTFRVLRATDTGSYTLRVTSSTQGATTSSAAQVVVSPEPTGPGSRDLSWAAEATPGGIASLYLAADGTAHVTSGIYNGDQYFYYVRKYDANGGLQPASVFDPGSGFDGLLSGLVRQSDGKVVVAGGFTTALGTARNTLARLNANGTLDPAFNPAPNNSVSALLGQTDGKLLVGGNFTTIAGASRNRIARLLATGAIDTTFAPGAHGLTEINRLLLATDGKVYVFGRNDTGGTDEIVRLTTAGALDGTFARITAPLLSIQHATLDSAGRLVVVGSFTTIAGQSRNRIARFTATGALDANFGSTRSSGPSDTLSNVFAAPDGYYYLINGSYSGFTYDGFDLGPLVRLDANGVLDPTFPAPTAARFSNLYSAGLAWANGKLVLTTGGGWFRVQVDGGATGAPVLLASSGDRTVVEGLSVSLSARFAGSGPFTYVWRRNGTIVAGATGPQLWLASATAADAGVYTVTATNASGSQTATMNLNFFAADPLSPTAGISLASNFNGTVTQLVRLGDGRVVVAGNFRTVAGVNSPAVARLAADGTLDMAFAAALPFSTTSTPNVTGFAVEADGRMLVAGSLPMPDNSTAYLVRLNTNGTLAGTLLSSTNMNSQASVMALQADGKIVLAGYFTTVLGQPRAGLARLLANGTLDPAYQSAGLVSSNGVSAIHLDASGRILLGGNFTSVGGAPASGRAVRLSADGTLDTTFNVTLTNQPNGFFRASDGRLFAYANSALAQLGGGSACVVQLNADGSLNPAFIAPNTAGVYAMGEDSFGRLYVVQTNALVRLLPGGLADRTVSVSGSISALAAAGDRLLVAGGANLSGVAGVTVPGIAYLLLDAPGALAVAASPAAAVTVNEGGVATLRAGIRGPAGTTYQWFRNGTAIPGATGPVLALNHLTPAANGSYTLVATSGATQVTTAASVLTVTPNLARPGDVDIAWGAGRSVTGVAGFAADAAGNVFAYGNVQINGGATRPVVAFAAADGAERAGFALSARVSGSVAFVAPQADGKLLVGGYSSSLRVDGVATGLLRLNADGSVDDTFARGVVSQYGSVQAARVLASGQILAMGNFSTYGGVAVSGVVRLSAAGAVDATFTGQTVATGGSVAGLLPAPEGKWWVVGRDIDAAAESARAFYRLNADGTRDPAFKGPTMLQIGNNSENISNAVAAPDGGFYFLSSITSSPELYMVRRVTPEGVYDGGFDAGQFVRTDYVGAARLNGLAVDGAGRLLVVGQFARHDGVTRNMIVRLLADGRVDASFTPVLPVPASQSGGPTVVFATANRVLLWGATSYGGLTDRSGLHALHAAELPASAAPVLTGEAAPVALASYDPLALALPVLAPASATIQWFRNGTAIPGATSASYRVRSASPAAAGNYHATVQTAGGTVTIPAIPVTTPALGYSGALSARNAAASIVGTIRFAVTQPDGRILVVSDGALVNGQGPFELFRLNADGSFHSGLPTQVRRYYDSSSATLQAAVVDGDGRIYLGGDFTKVNGVTRNRVARLLANGSVDATWDAGAGPNSTVSELALAPDGKLFIGGGFSQVAGVARQSLARLGSTGALDPTFVTGTGLNGQPTGLVVQSDGRLVVAGNFTTYNGGTATRLIRLGATGLLDATFAPAPNNAVAALTALPDGRLLAGGNFSQVAGVTRTGLALLSADGALLETTFNYSTGLTALSAAADGGVFALYGTTLARFSADGVRDTVFTNGGGYRGSFTNAATTPQSVSPTSVLAAGGEALVTGPFFKVGASTRYGAAWISPSDSLAPVIASAPANATLPEGGSVQWTVNAVAPTGTLTYTWTKLGASGVFSTSFSLARNNVTLADAGTYRVVVSNGEGTAEATVSLAVTPRAAYAPGSPRLEFYAPSVSSATAVASAGQGKWWVMGGGALRRLLSDGSVDTTFTAPTVTGSLQRFWVAPDGRLYATGSFTAINGQAVKHLARFSAEGVFDPTFVAPFATLADTSISIYALAFTGYGRIYVGGSFEAVPVSGRPTNHLVRLLENGAVDDGFDPLGGMSAGDSGRDNVLAVAVLADGRVIAGGSFTGAGGAARKGLVRFLPTGALDAAFNNIDISSVTRVEVLADGKLLVGGSFSTVDGLSRPRLVRLSADGVVDPAFALTGLAINGIQSFLVRPDGRVVLFATLTENSVNVSRLVQLLADGGVDPSFDYLHNYFSINHSVPGSPLQPGYVTGGVLLPDGNLLVNGSFTLIDAGIARNSLVFVHGSPLAPVIVTPPQTATVGGGTAVSFTVTVSGTPEFTYQWRRNGAPIDGATGATYALASALVADAGDYTVTVTNSVGTALSAAATLTVTQSAQTITFGALSDVVFSPTPIPLTASASSGLAVTFAVVSGPATINGGALTLTAPGTVTVRATQAGNAAFLAATPVERIFTATAPVTGFAAWQQGAFTTGELGNAAVSGPNADPDLDGFSNLVEYALGLAPKTATTVGLPEVTATATEWVFTYKRPAARSDLAYGVEFSTALATWTTNGVTHEFVSTSAGVETWRARVPLAGTANAFFRLKVTR